ncbi:MAG: hypothetical protein J6Y07_01045 [Alphaproteobacteria bacterium]|nr:hypothetical protein [Alphaproteobacteria bacterium]
MKFLTAIIGILPVLCVVAPASALVRAGGGATPTANPNGRISVMPSVGVANAANLAAARRLPTLLKTGTSTTITTTTGTTSSDSALMDEVECVERYTECIKASDVCDFNFEECTTSELFYAKKPQCNSVLLQCTSAGIDTLFGTSNIANLAAKNANDEYVYPTAGSVLGQFIEAGAISNRLDTSSCVKRYTSCLHKENVCGEDFELCTTNDEFKKQKIYCESTLARCQDEGKKELFGQTDTSRAPTSQSRLGVMIAEGQGLAAVNAVSTCYKVADQCFLAACTANPYKCIVNSENAIVMATDDVNGDATSTKNDTSAGVDVVTTSVISRYLKNACADTIGGNKYCHMTVHGGDVPSSKELIDEDNREEVYSDIYASRMNNALRDKIQKLADAFDQRALSKCSDTITACAMRSCGSGLGSACYSKVFGNKTNCFDKGGIQTISLNLNLGLPSGLSLANVSCSVNGKSTYPEIKIGCESIVNTDANCKYAAASVANKAYNYSYEYSNGNAFNVLFPQLEESTNDPIGVVTRLNASLAENYNDAAIEKMGKECRNTAISCIRSMCGKDFVNCYRNRTDVMTDTYNTDQENFNKSMNKVGGVLDFTIVRGLCVNTVKGSPKCEEHLKIQAIKKYVDGNGNTGWGDKNTVRDAWVDAVSDGYKAKLAGQNDVLVGCVSSSEKSPDGQYECDITNPHECDTVDEDTGCLYDKEAYEQWDVYQLNMEATTLFQEVMGDLELEAQAKYNAKLTAEQHMCIEANNGGIMGKGDLSSTYMWVKLRNNRVPKTYSVNGLKSNEFVASNDLYGSFCRARVTIQSDDPDIQNYLQKYSSSKNWSTAYFAVGDVFTCGSWIPQKELENIANRVACKKAKAEGKIDHGFDCNNATNDTIENLKLTVGQQWAVAGSAIGGAGLLGVGMDLLQTKTGLGGLLKTKDRTTGDERKLESEANALTALHREYCEGSTPACDSTDKCFTTDLRRIGSDVITTYTYAGGKTKGNKTCSELLTGRQTIWNKIIGSTDGTSTSENKLGQKWARAGADLTAATAGGVVAGIGVNNALKAKNREEFTANQQAFMNEIGDHIYCFIGADEAGTYGDLIEISVE